MAKRIRGALRVDAGTRPMPLSLFSPGAIGARVGQASDGVLFGALTPQAVGVFKMLDVSGPTYVTDTTDINDADAGDVLLMPATEAAGADGTGDEALYGHSTKKFTGIKITLSTAGTDGAVVWEYWNGTAWTNLATAHNLVDSTTGYTAGTSTYFVTWNVPTDWALKTIDTVSAYWVRSRVSTEYTINPAATRAYLLTVNDGVGLYVPSNGTITRVSFNALTVSGAADSVFQLINLSQGLFRTVSFTQAVAAQKGATVSGSGLPVGRGDSLVLQQVASHGTPAQNVTFIPEIN